MTEIESHLHDLLCDFGLPATLDGLSSLCRQWEGWARADRDRRKEIATWRKAADRLHALSLEIGDFSPWVKTRPIASGTRFRKECL